MARTQSKDYPEIREKILRTAARLFAEKGFSTATIVDLANACGSSRGALYHYFESKEEILGKIVGEHVATMLHELEAIGEQRLEPKEHLRAVVRQIMEINAVNKAEQIVLLNDWNQLDAPLQAEIGASQRKIVAVVRDALARLDTSHRMTPKSATTYAMSLLGSLNYTYAWFDPEGPVTPAEYADHVFDVFLHGFLRD
ncbi:TetR/AcrR family transcriptional regulator [Seohaeicola zhoushanensis]|uniref:TetR family transcriptional regulator n=1 Tax=Seohaeicola zhoushanensis TaxID=1569283 RepID=A0A8J3GXU5_9RHOB|nr:TetR/AcrR family transcriptional regulator [Seohaeicola zhoushanensis]GHF55172.1 TetR family transcriptional regulator [Seohaeicola zhoushanensis]